MEQKKLEQGFKSFGKNQIAIAKLVQNKRKLGIKSPWTVEEKKAFFKVVEKHGMNMKLLNKAVPNRNRDSIRGYA